MELEFFVIDSSNVTSSSRTLKFDLHNGLNIIRKNQIKQ